MFLQLTTVAIAIVLLGANGYDFALTFVRLPESSHQRSKRVYIDQASVDKNTSTLNETGSHKDIAARSSGQGASSVQLALMCDAENEEIILHDAPTKDKCEPTCDNEHPMCLMKLNDKLAPECWCRFGYLRDKRTAKCVLRHECTDSSKHNTNGLKTHTTNSGTNNISNKTNSIITTHHNHTDYYYDYYENDDDKYERDHNEDDNSATKQTHENKAM